MTKQALLMAACLLALPPNPAWPPARAADTAGDLERRVLKIIVTRTDGGRELGSAVPLAGTRAVTNCHVLRAAERIEVLKGEALLSADTDLRDAYRDLCFITIPGLRAEPMPMVEMGQTQVGMAVSAVGYPGGEYAATRGRIIGLHDCECDGGRVIQTSAPFDRGASGGGLFDDRGRLVGILTFKAKAGGHFHFALPVGWLRHMVDHGIEPISGGDAFWEQPGRESGYFLAACDLGARKKWRPLLRLAQDWTRQEPHNPEAWMALGRGHRGLDQHAAAAAAFQKVLGLDSTHAEARWALQELEFQLDRRLLDGAGM